MFVIRMALSITVSVAAIAGTGCETSDGVKVKTADTRPTASAGVAESDGDHGDSKPSPTTMVESKKTATAPADESASLAEYRDHKKTWCDERPVQAQEEFYTDGKPMYRYEVVMSEDGEFVRHGKSTDWWESGEKKLEMSYVCGVKHGPKRTWFSNGAKWAVGGFFEGKDNGTWIVWDAQGVKAKQYRIEKGVWQGLFTVWHPNGQKKIEVEFVDGLRQGNMTFWDEHGNVLKVIEYLDGKEQPMPGA